MNSTVKYMVKHCTAKYYSNNNNNSNNNSYSNSNSNSNSNRKSKSNSNSKKKFSKIYLTKLGCFIKI